MTLIILDPITGKRVTIPIPKLLQRRSICCFFRLARMASSTTPSKALPKALQAQRRSCVSSVTLIARKFVMNDVEHTPIAVRHLARLRTRARLHDVLIRKACGGPHVNKHGELMLVDLYRNDVTAGSSFDLTLSKAEVFVGDWSRT